jgi:hypothetical protein
MVDIQRGQQQGSASFCSPIFQMDSQWRQQAETAEGSPTDLKGGCIWKGEKKHYTRGGRECNF